MSETVRQISWPIDPHDEEANLTREWLVSNGLGGYASGTVSGVVTRRYHGMLIAALPAPHGRIVMLSHVAEQLRFTDGRRIEIGGRERVRDTVGPKGSEYVVSFRLENGLPVWRFDVNGIIIERRVFLTHMQNTVHLLYQLIDGADQIELTFGNHLVVCINAIGG